MGIWGRFYPQGARSRSIITPRAIHRPRDRFASLTSMFTLWVCLLLTPVSTCGTWQVLHFRNEDECVTFANEEVQGQKFSFCAPKWEEA